MASNPRRRLAEVQKPKPPPATDPAAYARGVLHAEAEAIEQLCSRIDGDFSDAVDRILACSGRVVVTGMGKPGFIAQKISATFASTGTPSLFLHPAEALHGDLGRLVPGDLVVALSNSGETEEILRLLPALKRLGAPIIAITGGQKSSLAAAVSASSIRVQTDVAVASPAIESRPNYAVQRKAERVSMTGTNAYAVLGEAASRRAKVLDLGFGGVALELDTSQSLPENFLAILHVPILPPVRVNLKPVWSRPSSEGALRVGCCFIS